MTPPPPLRLHTVFVAYNRIELTKQAVESYLETVTLPYSYLIVDNHSTDGTQDWLAEEGHPALLLGQNFYPGYATNRGWEQAPDEATLLQRADNDFAFLPGWCTEVERRFTRDRRLGQLGLRDDRTEVWCSMNTGGNCVIRRELFDKGLRYDEQSWRRYKPGYSEDSFFSPRVKQMGYRWYRVKEMFLVSLATGDWNDDYYKQSYGDRKIQNPAKAQARLERRERTRLRREHG